MACASASRAGTDSSAASAREAEVHAINAEVLRDDYLKRFRCCYIADGLGGGKSVFENVKLMMSKKSIKQQR